MHQSRRKYNSEFKRPALAFVEKEGRTVKDVAENLGITPAFLYR